MSLQEYLSSLDVTVVVSCFSLFISALTLVLNIRSYLKRRFNMTADIETEDSFIIEPLHTGNGNRASVALSIVLANNSEMPLTIHSIRLYHPKRLFNIMPERPPEDFKLILPCGEGSRHWNPEGEYVSFPLRLPAFDIRTIRLVFPSSMCSASADQEEIYIKIVTARGTKKKRAKLSTPAWRKEWFQ